MRLVKTVREVRRFREATRAKRQTIAFVPTMGALHEGHLKLVERAHKLADRVIVSIFVNPTQFGPTEDLSRYPRDLKSDLAKLKPHKVDVVFFPTADAMYPKGHGPKGDQTWVEVGGVTEGLCGASRPGHFRGVATVVLKLFNIVAPDIALFGEKDYQQLMTIRHMVDDLHLPVKIVGIPTVRERDGLAMSSRNVFLSHEQRASALALPKALHAATEMVRRGLKSAIKLKEMVTKMLQQDGNIKIDYVEVCDSKTLQPVEICRGARLLAAIHVGVTRLIDNCSL